MTNDWYSMCYSAFKVEVNVIWSGKCETCLHCWAIVYITADRPSHSAVNSTDSRSNYVSILCEDDNGDILFFLDWSLFLVHDRFKQQRGLYSKVFLAAHWQIQLARYLPSDARILPGTRMEQGYLARSEGVPCQIQSEQAVQWEPIGNRFSVH